MKKITKGTQPPELDDWFKDNGECPQNLYYDGGSFPKKPVLKGLLNEQGNLCAYTLLKIDADSAHNEHLKPQGKCKEEDKKREQNDEPLFREDVDWNNLVACFPRPNAPHPGFGAVKKDRWWDEPNFVSPLSSDCETRFTFDSDGTVSASSDGDTAAAETIDKLRLYHERLEDLRLNAIMGAGLHKRSEAPITSVEEVHQFIQKLDKRNSGGYPEFCTVLKHVAQRHIQFLEKHSPKTRGD